MKTNLQTMYHENTKLAHVEHLARQMEAFRLSEHGKAWLMKALYPPGPQPATAPPTEGYVPSVIMDYRPSRVITPPPGLSADSLWDACIIIPPGDNVAAVIATGGPSTDFLSGVGIIAKHFLCNQGSSRGTPVPGVLVRGEEASTAQYEVLDDMAETSAFRLTHKSVTLHSVASSLFNGGTLTAAQIPIAWTQSPGAMQTANLQSDGVGVPWTAAIPLNEREISLMAPGAWVGEFKDGLYMPVRLQDLEAFCHRATLNGRSMSVPAGSGPGIVSLGAATAATASLGNATLMQTTRPGTSVASSWFGTHTVANSQWDNSSMCPDTGPTAASTGIILIRGMSQQASFTLTVRTGVERVVQPQSSLATLTRPPALPDPVAVEAYYAIASKMTYCYPANYNAVGAILPLIGSAVRLIAPHLLAAAAAHGPKIINHLQQRLASRPALPAPTPRTQRTPSQRRPALRNRVAPSKRKRK